MSEQSNAHDIEGLERTCTVLSQRIVELEKRTGLLEQRGAVWDITQKLVHILAIGIITTVAGSVVALVVTK